MNSVGNNLLTNTPAGSVVNGVTNSVTSAVSGTYAPLFLLLGIALLLGVAYLFMAGRTSISDLVPGLGAPPADWRAIERQERQEAREERREARQERAGFGENWCFVGEDVTGRWCVKVPQPDACSPERLFSSRPGCELVPASPLPLGLIAKNGAEMNPLIAASHTK
jgi:hypothetical protein